MNDYFGLVQTQDGGAITGEIRAGLFAIAPYGWLKCDGSTFDKEQYPKLAALLPSGKTPDLREASLSGRNLEALGSVVGSNNPNVPLLKHSHSFVTTLRNAGERTKYTAEQKGGASGPGATNEVVESVMTGYQMLPTKIAETGTDNPTIDVRGKRCIVNFIIRAI